MKTVSVLISLFMIGIVSCSNAQESLEVAVFSGNEPKEQIYQAKIVFSKDGFIESYTVDWLGKSSMKNLSYTVSRNQDGFLIHENVSNQDLWEINVKDNSISISYKGNRIATGNLEKSDFSINYTGKGNLLSLKKNANWELLLENDMYVYSKKGDKIRRLFSKDDGVIVTERKLSSTTTEISELADYGRRHYQIKGTIAPKRHLQNMVNTIVFSQNFVEEVMPFLWGSH